MYKIITACANTTFPHPFAFRSSSTQYVCSLHTLYRSSGILAFLLPLAYIYEDGTVAAPVRVLPEKMDHQ